MDIYACYYLFCFNYTVKVQASVLANLPDSLKYYLRLCWDFGLLVEN